VPVESRLGRWGLSASFGAVAAAVGLLAGIDPRFAIAAALSLAFLLLVLGDLYVGLILFTLLTFIAQVPTVAGPGLSFAKIAGLLLAISWVATLAARHEARSDFMSAHPGLTYLVVLFLSWAAVSQLWAEDSGEALTAASRLALNAVLFLIIFTAVRKPSQAIGFVAAFVAGASLDALYGLFVAPSDPDTASRLSSSITNPNELASVLVTALVLSFGLAVAMKDVPLARLGALCAGGLCTAGIFLTGSRGGLVALAVAMIAFLIVGARWRGRLALVVVAVVLVGVGYYNFAASPEIRSHVSTVGSGTGRLDLWTVGWRMVEDEPLQGVGAGNFPVSSVHYLLQPGAIERADYIVGSPKVAHNTYLELWAELGIVGLALFVILAGSCLYAALRAARSFGRQGDARMEIIARALFVALAALLAADFFGSRLANKEIWLLLGLAPALLAIARSREGPASS
jgi:putative inorganic carbon (HCO3(-)) transporter